MRIKKEMSTEVVRFEFSLAAANLCASRGARGSFVTSAFRVPRPPAGLPTPQRCFARRESISGLRTRSAPAYACTRMYGDRVGNLASSM